MRISTEMALALADAGLQWRPSVHDFFFVPNSEVDDRIFVLTDVMANYEILHGMPAITFNGVVEWALDYVLQSDATWLPTEAQLRTLLERRIGAGGRLIVEREADGYRLTVGSPDDPLYFRGPTVADAYGQALLVLLADSGEE